MMKWFRKHTKKIMVVVVLFAMFSFVAGAALQSMFSPNPGATEFAVIFGEQVTNGDLNPAQADTIILDRLISSWKQFFNPKLRLEHWYMLTHEAADAGIVVPDEQVDGQLLKMGLTPERLAGYKPRGLFVYPVVRGAFARFLAVQQLAQRVMSTAMPSQTQVRHYVHDTEDKLRIRYAALDAARFIDGNEVIDEAELQEQFETHKDVFAEESEDGVGYKFPRRVRVQYFGVVISQIEPQMDVSFDEVKTYWRRNRSQYKTTDTSDPAASQPVEREMLFSEARMQVERELRQRKALQRSQQVMREAATELLRPWQDQVIDRKTGYKEIIPEVVRDPMYMRNVADRMSAKFGIPLEYRETNLLSQKELDLQPNVGRSRVAISQTQRLPLSEYAFRVPLFFKKAAGSETTLSLQLFQTPDTPLVATTINMQKRRYDPKAWYLFRVVEAREAESPASLAEVRDRVEKDVRKRHAFERIETDAKELYAVARHLGLEAALERMTALRTRAALRSPVTPTPFARRMARTLAIPTVAGLGAPSEEFIDACFEMANSDWTPPEMELPTTPIVAEATTQPAAEPAPKIRLVSLPKLKKRIVVEFVGLDPVRQDKYEGELRAQAFSTLRAEQARAIWTAWYDLSAIEKRCGFKRSTDDAEPAPPEGATAKG